MERLTLRTFATVRAALKLWSALSFALLMPACANGVTTIPGDEPPRPLDRAQKIELDAFVESALERYDVPGVAVAVIREGQVIYQAGYGVRDASNGRPVTTSTLFGLASLTKPITTTMMASLVDEGRLDWDQRAQDILPNFALSNSEWAAQVTLRHLAGMSSGVPENNTSLFVQRLPPTEIVAALPEITSLAPPGELYGYSNLAFSTGAFAATVRSGAPYDDASLMASYEQLMRERVFEPAGMTRATLDFDAATTAENHATPHRYDPLREIIEAVPIDAERFDSQVAPGGGVWADVADVAKFAITHFDGTALDGTRILSEASLREVHAGAVDMEPGVQYALGWEVWDHYLDVESLRHTGNSIGFTTSVRLVQDGQLGVVVLANEGFVDGFVAAIDRFVLELLLDRSHADDADALGALIAQKDWLQALTSQMTPVDRVEAEPYLGRYSHHTNIAFSEQGLTLQTDFGAYPLYSTDAPGLLAVGSMFTGLLAVQRSEGADGEPVFVMGRPISDPLTWPLPLEPLGR